MLRVMSQFLLNVGELGVKLVLLRRLRGVQASLPQLVRFFGHYRHKHSVLKKVGRFSVPTVCQLSEIEDHSGVYTSTVSLENIDRNAPTDIARRWEELAFVDP